MSGTPDTTTLAVTEEDRAKALVALEDAGANPHCVAKYGDAVAAVLAAERGKADALRAAMHALAEEWERGSVAPYWVDRLRAIADGQR